MMDEGQKKMRRGSLTNGVFTNNQSPGKCSDLIKSTMFTISWKNERLRKYEVVIATGYQITENRTSENSETMALVRQSA